MTSTPQATVMRGIKRSETALEAAKDTPGTRPRSPVTTRTSISGRHSVRLSLLSHRLADRRRTPMRSLMLALLLAFAAAPGARAEPASTLDGLWQLLGACSQSVGGPAGLVGSDVTVLFSIKRDGSLQGQPRITQSKLVGDDTAQKEFLAGVLVSIARCFPLPITRPQASAAIHVRCWGKSWGKLIA